MKIEQKKTAYDELVNFIASSDPKRVLSFRMSPQTAKRVETLTDKEKNAKITQTERDELDTYMHLSRIIILAQAQAHRILHGSFVS